MGKEGLGKSRSRGLIEGDAKSRYGRVLGGGFQECGP
mgnify:CR=1 FL=1